MGYLGRWKFAFYYSVHAWLTALMSFCRIFLEESLFMAKKIEPEHLELVKCSWSYRNWSEWYISQWNSRGSANVNVGALEASVGFKSVLLEKSDIMKICKSIYDIKRCSKAINYNFNISIYFNLINDQTGTKRWRKNWFILLVNESIRWGCSVGRIQHS